ncbi:MAG: GNAT family N-acetyltransferase [Bacteroidales bacterium]
MVESIKILKATINDLMDILNLQKTAFLTEAELYNDYDIEPLTQSFDSIKTDFKNYTFLKAEYESKIVGSVKARETAEFTWIGRLIVSPEYQNRGIGRKLMNQIENEFPGTKEYLLCTGYKSIKNIKLYESLGYQKSEIFYDERNNNLQLIKMIKRIKM